MDLISQKIEHHACVGREDTDASVFVNYLLQTVAAHCRSTKKIKIFKSLF